MGKVRKFIKNREITCEETGRSEPRQKDLHVDREEWAGLKLTRSNEKLKLNDIVSVEWLCTNWLN